MPVYNGACSLIPTIDSILGQTFSDFELIVVDDGSSDATPSLLDDFAARDPRVRVVRQENAGITRALIRGCSEARAPLVARHDCGDRSHPERLATQAALFDDGDVVLASCATTYFAPGGERLYTANATGEEIRTSLLRDPVETIRGLPHHGSAMFRRSAYEGAGGYRGAFYFAQDLDLWIRLAARGRIAVAPAALYDAAVATGAISSTHRAEQVESARIAIALRDGAPEAPLLAKVAAIRPAPRRRSRRDDAAALYFIASCLRRNGDPAWRKYLRGSLSRDPLNLRSWLLPVRPR
jgi:glycosyltransferase involved in cell wall biosynthesis